MYFSKLKKALKPHPTIIYKNFTLLSKSSTFFPSSKALKRAILSYFSENLAVPSRVGVFFILYNQIFLPYTSKRKENDVPRKVAFTLLLCAVRLCRYQKIARGRCGFYCRFL
jgi:hypothetical protein